MSRSTGNDGIDANGNCYINGGLVYAIVLIRDLFRNRAALRQAPGDWKVLSAVEFIVFFLCTIGVSDFLLNTLVIKKLRLADDKSLPSCLIASTIVPGALIAFSYLRAENAADTLYENVELINEEITAKRKEFGLETAQEGGIGP